MASLAQPSPKLPRKLPSVRDKWRQKTKYDRKRFTGYAPISFAMVAEVGRLTTGKATQLLYVILTASLGQMVDQTEAFNERAADLRTSDLAELCACDERTIQRELGDLKTRKVILWDQSKKGVNVITPLFRSWCDLPDYRPAPVLEPAAEADDEPESEDPAKLDKGTTRVTRKPVHVGAGKKSKAYPVDCGVSALQFDVRQLDADCSAVVKDGVLLVTLEPKWDASKSLNGLLKEKGIEEKIRQGCRISPSQTRGKGTKGERRTSGEDFTPEKLKSARILASHPRAAELSALFDGPIYQSCKKTLSGDPVALKKACQAIADTPHDYLVEFMEGRAERKIIPLHVPSICLEALHCWRKSKDMPVAKRDLTREEMDAMVARDRAARLAKRRAS